MILTRPIAALIVIAFFAVVPASADHATSCRDPYVCTSGGRVLTVAGSLEVDGGTISVSAEHHQGQRFSSEGHLETDAVSATLTLRITGEAPVSCSPDPGSITFSAAEIVGEIQVTSSDETCMFDLTWTPEDAPSPSVQRTAELVPGVPPAFYAAAAVGGSIVRVAAIDGTALGRAGAGEGTARDHWYVGHVTLSE